MAEIEMNVVTPHLKGRIGDIVFRSYKGRKFASLRPKVRPRTATPAMEAHRLRFRKARQYALGAVGDPSTAPVYIREASLSRTTEMGAAMRDWFQPPRVLEINTSGYHGRAGEVVSVQATDDTKVTEVIVTIKHATTQAILEQGPAQLEYEKWNYTCLVTLPASTSVVIEAVAKDLPGNEAMLTKAFP